MRSARASSSIRSWLSAVVTAQRESLGTRPLRSADLARSTGEYCPEIVNDEVSYP